MPYFENGPVRIRYEEAGSGFPVLVMPGGGLNSRVSSWQTAVYNFFDTFKDEYRVITMDQRNANQGESSGPLDSADPWGAFAADQLGLMNHLGVQEFAALGCCIGGPFVLKLMAALTRPLPPGTVRSENDALLRERTSSNPL